MKTKEAGFTLLESVLILLITASLILIPVLSIDKMVETVQVDLFFRELSSNITMMQNHSVLSGESTEILFRPYDSGHQIRFRVYGDSSHPLSKTMYLDESFYSLTSKSGSQFSFYGDTGNITTSDTIGFQTAKGKYELTHWLGSGRFAIDKVED